MKLFKIERLKDDLPEIWYFTNVHRVAKYLGTQNTHVNMVLKGILKHCKGWTVEEIESGDILSRYINPDKNIE